jgi:hypothetical protein
MHRLSGFDANRNCELVEQSRALPDHPQMSNRERIKRACIDSQTFRHALFSRPSVSVGYFRRLTRYVNLKTRAQAGGKLGTPIAHFVLAARGTA